MNFFKKKKILILGSTGFAGSWLCLFLLIFKADIYGISLKEKRNKFFRYLFLKKKIKQFYFNIVNEKKLNKVINRIKPDIIIHLASQSLVGDAFTKPKETIETNIIGLTNLFEVIRKSSLKRLSLLIATSDKCYLPSNKSLNEKSPLGGNEIYSVSKASQELITKGYYESYFKKKNIIITTVRAGNIIGPGDFNSTRLLPDILNAIFTKKKLIIRKPFSFRPWQSVLFCCYHYLLILEYLNKSKTRFSNWNIGPRKSLKVKSILDYVIKRRLLTKRQIVFKKEIFDETDKLSINSKKLINILKVNKKRKNFDAIKFTINESINLEKLKRKPTELYLHFIKIINDYLKNI
jgi:CDP-glucose 4,6-dehydratase